MKKEMDQYRNGSGRSPYGERFEKAALSEPPAGALSKEPAEAMEAMPVLDVDETEGHFLLSLEVPGMAREDISVELQGDQILVVGERPEVGERFRRSFTLPAGIDADRIEASYRSGFLELAIPKSPAGRRRRIDVVEGNDRFFRRFLHRVA